MVGFSCILCALSLAAYNKHSNIQAGNFSANVLEQMTPDFIDQTIQNDLATEVEPPATVITIDGYEYIGRLTMPTLHINLPVMADWSYPQLKLAPCRQFGTVQTKDLVIAAHNYKSHFGLLSQLDIGAPIQFTDSNGTTCYRVAAVKTLSPQEVDSVQNSGYPLVLYTCTPHGKTRVVVFCQFAN